VDPRFGFAWDVFSSGKTALKGGFGIFRNQLLHNNGYYQVIRSSPGGLLLNATNPNFPDPNVASAHPVTGVVPSRTYNPTGTAQGGAHVLPEVPATPSAMHWNLTLDQQLTPNTTVRLGYLGSHGYHLESGYPANTNTYVDLAAGGLCGTTVLPGGGRCFAPAGVHRLRPDFSGGVDFAAFDFNSFYNAFTVTFGRRATRGLGFEASYAFSRGTDDTSLGLRWRVNSTSEMRLPDGRRNTYHGLSGFDMRNRFVSNITYELPRWALANAFAAKLVSGWQVNSIVTIQGGTPFTAWVGFDRANQAGQNAPEQQRPDLRPGANSNRTSGTSAGCNNPNGSVAIAPGARLGTPDLFFDPCVFALQPRFTYGNAGRNTIIGPGLVNFDINLVKNTALTERMSLQFRAEGYNIFNNVNFLQPSSRMFETNGSYSSGAGKIVGTSTDSRQFQFALKLLF